MNHFPSSWPSPRLRRCPRPSTSFFPHQAERTPRHWQKGYWWSYFAKTSTIFCGRGRMAQRVEQSLDGGEPGRIYFQALKPNPGNLTVTWLNVRAVKDQRLFLTSHLANFWTRVSIASILRLSHHYIWVCWGQIACLFGFSGDRIASQELYLIDYTQASHQHWFRWWDFGLWVDEMMRLKFRW